MGGVFLIDDNSRLIEMSSTDYARESDLQELLERYPNLLAGDLIDADVPRKWLLVKREASVPDELGPNRFTIDHLMVDQDAIPTFVEVKRREDPRARREVVAQMLDYAANGVKYWPPGWWRATFEERATLSRLDARDLFLQTFGEVLEYEQFWNTVARNLSQAHVRLLFVVDDLPNELRNIVDFLNREMQNVEVLAVEIRAFGGGGKQVLVSRVYGQTEDARQRKAGRGPLVQWDEASFFERMERDGLGALAPPIRKLLEWQVRNMDRVDWMSNKDTPAFVGVYRVGENDYYPLNVRGSGTILVDFSRMWTPPFDREALRLEFLTRLNRIKGLDMPRDKIRGMAKVDVNLLLEDENFQHLVEALEWFRAAAARP